MAIGDTQTQIWWRGAQNLSPLAPFSRRSQRKRDHVYLAGCHEMFTIDMYRSGAVTSRAEENTPRGKLGHTSGEVNVAQSRLEALAYR